MTFELQGGKGNGNLGRKTTTAWETISTRVCVCVCVKQCDCSRDALKSHSGESDGRREILEEGERRRGGEGRGLSQAKTG